MEIISIRNMDEITNSSALSRAPRLKIVDGDSRMKANYQDRESLKMNPECTEPEEEVVSL